MAEEVKKAPKPVDVNSAKYKLGKIAADAYVDAIEAKKRGEKVAWVSSNFPVEIPRPWASPPCTRRIRPPASPPGGGHENVRGGGVRGLLQRYMRLRPCVFGLRQAEILSRAGRGHARRAAVLQQHLLLHDQVVREPGP